MWWVRYGDENTNDLNDPRQISNSEAIEREREKHDPCQVTELLINVHLRRCSLRKHSVMQKSDAESVQPVSTRLQDPK